MSGIKKLLTVVVPAYNMEAYLPKCLESLVVPDEKMRRLLDVVVVNDGSKDRTSEIAHGFSDRHPGIFRVVDKENGNYGSCVNVGVREAQGDYVKILDADDTFDTPSFVGYMKRLFELASSENPPDAVFNDFVETDENGLTLALHDFGFTARPGFDLGDFAPRRADRTVWMHALAYKTEFLRSIGYKQTEGIYYTDQEWDMIPLSQAKSFAFVPEQVYRYLVGRPGQSIDPDVKCRNFGMHLPVSMKIIAFLEEKRANLSPGAVAMLESQIENHLHVFFYCYLVKFRKRLDETEISRFDSFLAERSQKFHEITGRFSIKGFLVNSMYVKEWRETGKIGSYTLLRLDAARTVKKLLADIGLLKQKGRHE